VKVKPMIIMAIERSLHHWFG